MKTIETLQAENLALRLELERVNNLLNSYSRDELTGLKMRRDFDKKINEFFETEATFYLIFADVNGLHKMNRLEGYKAGDNLIKRVADDCSKMGLAYRLGGDEFTVLTTTRPNITQNKDRVLDYVSSEGFSTPEEMVTAVDKKVTRQKEIFYSLDKNNRRG